MDWFKKILHVFKEDTDEHKQEKEEKQQVLRRKLDKQQEGPKDVNGRIAYQYPKGANQTPLVRDVLKKKENRPPRQINTQHQIKKETLGQESRVDSLESLRRFRPRQEKIKQAEEIVKPVPEVETEQLQEKAKAKAKAKEKAKTERIRYGPFRPTEIPSPIYGYERPQSRQNKIIEHELTGFFDHIPTRQEEEIAASLETVEPAPTSEVNTEESVKPFVEELQAEEVKLNELEAQIEEAQPIVEELQTEAVEFNEPEAQIEEAQPIVEELQTEAVELNEPEAQKEEAPLIVEEVHAEGIELNEQLEAQKEEAPLIVEEVHAEDVELIEREELTESIIAPPSSSKEIEPKVVEPIVLEKQAEPVKIIKFPIQEQQPKIVETETTVHVTDEGHHETMNEQHVTKSHIPFNVIMLKQDRLKLTNQNLVNEPQVKSPVNVDANNNEHEIQDFVNDAKEVASEPQQKQETFYEPLNYQYPETQLLTPPVIQEENDEWLLSQEELLNRTLNDFNVGAKVVNVTQGPSVTRFEVQPDPGVKVNKITNLQDDIKLSLAAKDIRIEAPIPGKHTIGIEVPNGKSRPVFISEIISSPEFKNNQSPLTAALGLDISGKPVVTDLRKMPHGLIAGATGSGKSVCINSILTSLLYKADPHEVKLLLIDPKMVELAPYNYIPHLVSPVITDVKAATAALKWAVEEMERRYELFVHTGVREISRFNELAEEAKRYSDKLPYILIVIDELADLMMVAPGDVEEAICRIAQKARACGIHLIIATQRPSVDVITGLIKANIPTRIAFSVSSQIDSRTIIDIAGAEKLLGRGDMLFLENGTSKPVRLQGTYISDTEIDDVVEHVRSQAEPDYLFEQGELLKKAQVMEDEDELFFEACEFIVEQGVASTSSLQRRFKIGYNRAARLIDMMHSNGYISEAKGSKPRDVLITEEELDSLNSSSTIN
ncbi:DNA translocase FtsK [Bacillus marasmi]|uniref:DNA translocase FtsK n=1 Tax=Bacillus marasmi TaxID=1926279 RepID=UPI0011C9B0E5|nr:DNA translocase FtsK [Bacillus marasmi]